MNSEMFNKYFHELLVSKFGFRKQDVFSLRLGLAYDYWHTMNEVCMFHKISLDEAHAIFNVCSRVICENISNQDWFPQELSQEVGDTAARCELLGSRLSSVLNQGLITSLFCQGAYDTISDFWVNWREKATVVGANACRKELLVGITGETSKKSSFLIVVQNCGISVDVLVSDKVIALLHRRRPDIGAQLAVISSFVCADGKQEMPPRNLRLLDFKMRDDDSGEQWVSSHTTIHHRYWAYDPFACLS